MERLNKTIIDHNHEAYRKRWENARLNKYNGAFYYSKEITKYFIPNIKTDRNWVTVNVPAYGADHAIVFIHNNLHPNRYDWLNKYDDLILVCGVPETMEKVAHLGTPLYLPLSIDVKYVSKFKHAKTKSIAFAGRRAKRRKFNIPSHIDILESMPRQQLLTEMGKYHQIYAVGRTAIEAKALGCQVLPYDERFPDPSIWKVVDSMEAVDILQKKLNEIEKENK